MNNPSKQRILLVEDNPDDVLMLRRMLRGGAEAYELLVARTGQEGVRMCRSEEPACVLLDYHLPDMGGREFLEAIRTDGGDGLRCPVAVLTGQEDNDVASEVLAHGAQDYLVKGTLTAEGLLRAIRNAVQKFEVLRELEEKRASLELRNFQLEALREELQERLMDLEDATRAKEQFLAVMSHEMRTPLNAILGYADLLEMGLGGELSDAQRTYLDRVRVGGRHLLDLINDVLDLARADADKLEVDLRPVDVNAVLEEVTALMESQAGAKGIELRVQLCGGEGPHAHADLRRLRQVLTNLVGNAIKFTEEGSVTIRCDARPERTVIEVADTGIGIDPGVLPLIFGEFYQVEGELTRQKGGSGLGLAIAQRLMRLMGGEIAAESRVGDGSTFTLTLPRAAPGSELRSDDVEAHLAHRTAREVAAAGREVAAGGRDAAPPAVVVAFGDDRDALRELTERVLPNVRLVWTVEAGQVTELARREQASLVVLDITCREGAGWRAAHAIQEHPELSSTAILLLPRLPQPRPDEEPGSLNLGWVSLVPKPFTEEQLTHAVANAAGTAPEEEERAVDVLVVDDDPDSRRVAGQFLSTVSARVREATDGETALLAMRRKIPDVVVLDLMMPVLDGFGVLATMRADARLAQVPVVVLSAKQLSEAERDFLARTAVRVLQKGEHRLSDVAQLVIRAAAQSRRGTVPSGAGPP